MKDEGELSLFSAPVEAPLAERMRPENFEDLVGQAHFLNPKFRQMLSSDRWTGLIFWGPPGTGKTTLARLIARITGRPFDSLSAVTSGVKDIREVLERSRKEVLSGRVARILFIDEVHRLNKAQQDVLLPYLEDGTIRFIGATTENPSFEINNAIASRSVIFQFKSLKENEVLKILQRAAKQYPNIDPEVLEKIATVALGDARRALTLLDHLVLSSTPETKVNVQDFEELKHSQSIYYDKKSESHFDTISAFIKSIRGSDPDAAVYYLARMIEGGEDPLFIARRLIILASEDIGNAAPMGLVLANAAFQACHSIGMPEARIVLAQATTYLACAEKSNRAYMAIESALEAVRRTGNLEIPLAIRNAPTSHMKELGYGQGYQYAHNTTLGWAPMQFLPDALSETRFYKPTQHGHEKLQHEFLKKRGKSDENPQHS